MKYHKYARNALGTYVNILIIIIKKMAPFLEKQQINNLLSYGRHINILLILCPDHNLLD